MKQKRLKNTLAFLLVLCMAFGVQANIVFAQGNDVVTVQRNVPDDTDTVKKDDVIVKTESDSVKLKHNIALASEEVNSDTEITPQSGDSIIIKTVAIDDSWEDCESCSKNQPHLISNTADLDKIRTHKHNNAITGYFRLENDIVFSDEDFKENGDFYNDGWGWTPIGNKKSTGYGNIYQFQGDFNGNGYSIKNIKMEVPNGYWYNGLFAALGGEAHIYDCQMENFDIFADGAGVLCGQCYGSNMIVENIKLKDCKVKAILTASKTSAILIGESAGTIRNIEIMSSSYSATGGAWRGGFITNTLGANSLLENIVITNCDIDVYAYTGLLVGMSSGNSIIKDIVIKGSKLHTRHGSWSYLVYEGSLASSVISNVTIDISVSRGATLSGSGGFVLPVNNDNPQIRNVNVRAEFEDGSGVVDVRVEDNALYIKENLDEGQLNRLIARDYQVVGYVNGGEFLEDTEFPSLELKRPVKKGNIFEGWYENKDLSGDAVTSTETGKTYYAKWKEKENSSVTFKNSLNIDKIYDKKAVSLSKDDCVVTGTTGEVTFSFQVKEDDEWKDIDFVPINAGTYQVKAIIAENDTHKSAETYWKEFTISKATPTYAVPTDLTAIVGQTLANVKLPQGFTWQDEVTTPVGDVGTHTFLVSYNPDTRNFNTINDIKIILTVNSKIEVLNEAPVIQAEDKTLTVGDKFNAKDDVQATDAEDGDITKNIEVINNNVDTSKAGTYVVTYRVTDKDGASVTKTITVMVIKKEIEKPTIDNDNSNQTGSAAKTSDMTNMTTWITLMIISLGLLAGAVAGRKLHKAE